VVSPNAGGAACDQALAVGISRIDLPEYLQQKRIVLVRSLSVDGTAVRFFEEKVTID
jgi:hypothetical protein